jgi:hypothetical protein
VRADGVFWLEVSALGSGTMTEIKFANFLHFTVTLVGDEAPGEGLCGEQRGASDADFRLVTGPFVPVEEVSSARTATSCLGETSRSRAGFSMRSYCSAVKRMFHWSICAIGPAAPFALFLVFRRTGFFHLPRAGAGVDRADCCPNLRLGGATVEIRHWYPS